MQGAEKSSGQGGNREAGKTHINNRGCDKCLHSEGDATISMDMGAFGKDAAWDGTKGHVAQERPAARAAPTGREPGQPRFG